MSNEPVTAPRVASGAPAASLGQQDFLPLALAGWGDGWNSYVHSMAWFEGQLYCGTLRANLGKKRRKALLTGWPKWPVWPIRCSDDVFEDVDMRAQIWRTPIDNGSWELAFSSPMVTGRHGKEIARDDSYRSMVVFQGRSDSKPVLYVTPHTDFRSPGPCMLRSEDGKEFHAVSEPGIGLAGVRAFRFLVPFRGRLYTSPIGSAGEISSPNESRYPLVFECDDPAGGEWVPASTPGFGDSNNSVVFNMAAFGDFLYAVTFNHVEGFQLWKTRAEGRPPYQWSKVLDAGAYRGNLNQGVAAMCVFGDALYLGTGIQHGGYDRENRIGPAGAEVIRVFPDDSWDLLVGNGRLTMDGLKTPLSGFAPGFNNLFNGYVWQMCAHRGRLYLGTLKNPIFLRYMDRDNWRPAFREIIEALGVDETIAAEGGFDIWSSADGESWTPVTVTGFANPYNFGARNLVSTPHGLAVGTANSFGPEVAVPGSAPQEWSYELNPRGGAEVWLGDRELPPAVTRARVHGAGASAASFRLPALARGFRAPGDLDRPVDPGRFDLDRQELAECARKTDVGAVFPHVAGKIRNVFRMREEGFENVPPSGPALFVGNDPSQPRHTGIAFIVQHWVLTLHAINAATGRQPMLLIPPRHLVLPPRLPFCRRTTEQLGFVPATVHNAVQLLEMGSTLMCYPEPAPSAPVYQVGVLDHDFVRMSWIARAPVVPIAFVGSHESHIVIESHGRRALVLGPHENQSGEETMDRGKTGRTDTSTMRGELMTDYQLTVLPALQARDHVEDVEDQEQVAAFAELVRSRLQECLNREIRRRPIAQLARTLQTMYGTPPPGKGASGATALRREGGGQQP